MGSLYTYSGEERLDGAIGNEVSFSLLYSNGFAGPHYDFKYGAQVKINSYCERGHAGSR